MFVIDVRVIFVGVIVLVWVVSAALVVLEDASAVGVVGIVVVVDGEEVFVGVVWVVSAVPVVIVDATAVGVGGLVTALLADSIIASQSIRNGDGVAGVGVAGLGGVGGLGIGLLLGWCLCPWCRS